MPLIRGKKWTPRKAEYSETYYPEYGCGFSALEIPLSCPHTPGYGTLAGHSTPLATEEITRAVRAATERPIFVKLSPSIPGIGELALAAMEGGADGISAVNSLGPGMVIDVEAREPVLDFKVGGVSGPALRPVAVRCVYDVATALRKADLEAPIIGIGGVATGRDALEMIMAGATVTQVCASLYRNGIKHLKVMEREMLDWMEKNEYESVQQMCGSMSQRNVPNPAAFQRSSYMRVLSSYPLRDAIGSRLGR
jgi:dihydroorotate dehydrogenase (NAD+) catalytic subunit